MILTLCAILTYVQGALQKKQLIASSKEATVRFSNLKESHENIKSIIVQCNIIKFDQKKYSTLS